MITSDINIVTPHTEPYDHSLEELYDTVLTHYNEEEYVKAAEHLKMASDKGHLSATNNLAFMYGQGLGVKQDYPEACRLYKIASDKGHVEATCNLASMYMSGLGVKQDYHEACRLYKIASDKGHAPATFALAQLYHHGLGVKQDSLMALHFVGSSP